MAFRAPVRWVARETRATLFRTSGQGWKVVALLIAMSAGFATACFGLYEAGSACTWAGVSCGAAALAVSSWSVRCASCGMRWLAVALRDQPCTRWLDWLLALERCPQCESVPGVEARPAAREQSGDAPER